MKKPWAFQTLLWGSLLAAGMAAAEPIAPAKPLAPGPDDAPITNLVSLWLAQRQFLHSKPDDAVASRFLDQYLDALDPQHMLFRQSDLADFGKWRTTLDELTWQKNDTTPAYTIFTRLVERAREQRDFVAEELKTGTFAFDKSDTYSVDRDKAARPASLADAKQLWRERLRYEYLQEKLNDKKPEEIVKTLNRRYDDFVRTLTQFDSDEVLELYLSTLSHVFDPHSGYLGRASYEEFGIQMKLSLFGIGARLQSEDGYCKVVEVTPGGPAAKSGQIKAGDRIVGVAQGGKEPVDVVGMKLGKIVDMIRGQKGTTVQLTIIPADAADTSARKTVTLVRDEIKLEEQEAKAEVVDVPAANGQTLRLGVIDLPSFYAGGDATGRVVKSATDDVQRLLKKLNEVGVKGLILDLRNNGGGSLDEAIRLTGLFIKEGPVVQVRDPDGSVEVDRDPDPGIAYSGPMVVLVNRGTASASEILAGALQDYGRAVIAGDGSTFGKGTVQSVMSLAPLLQRLGQKTQHNPGALKVTIQKFYRPSGASTQLKGVVPDIVLPSLTDVQEVGERVMDNPLPWDTIKSSEYMRTDQVKPFVDELRKRSEARTAADRDFEYVRTEAAQIRKTLAEKQVSLNEAERRRVRAEAEARLKARKEELAKRPASNEKVTTITLKKVDTPGLPPADPVTAQPSAQVPSRVGAAPTGPDYILGEGKRILADLISLSGGK
jgi:carboxyl-terminal processing protease